MAWHLARVASSVLLASLTVLSLLAPAKTRAESEGESIGREAFERACAACHGENPIPRAPGRELLAKMPPEAIYRSLAEGLMIIQAAALNDLQKRAVAIYLSDIPWGSVPEATPEERLARCEGNPPLPAEALAAPHWIGWGIDHDNTHFQPAEHAGLRPEDLGRLVRRWAIGFPGATWAMTQPTVIAGRIYVGSPTAGFYALDAERGCAYWKAQTRAPVRAGFALQEREDAPGRFALFAGDRDGFAYAFDAHSGELLWETELDDHAAALVTSTPVLYEGALYYATASLEELAAGSPTYECCTFRGSVSSLDPATGAVNWKTYVVPEPKPTRTTKRGTQLYGPSGVGIWSTPTIDPKQGVLYVTTGDNYSQPATDTSDAVMALDLATGAVRWKQQMLAGDAWSSACEIENPDEDQQEECGPDLDFGAAAVLRELPDGRRLLFAGQKSGVLHALDPDREGAIVWQKRLSPGGVLGGIEWGFAADDRHLYVPISDVWENASEPGAAGGIFKIAMETGDVVWHRKAEGPDCGEIAGCSAGQPAAATLIPGVVFSGSMDGHMRAYDTSSGEVLWDVDTKGTLETVNGVPGSGGSLKGAGATVVNGWVYFATGYGIFGMAGNGFVAYGPPE